MWKRERGDKGFLSALQCASPGGCIAGGEAGSRALYLAPPGLDGRRSARLLQAAAAVCSPSRGWGPPNGPPSVARKAGVASVRQIFRWIGGRGSRFLFEYRATTRPVSGWTRPIPRGSDYWWNRRRPERLPPQPGADLGNTLRTAIVARMLYRKGLIRPQPPSNCREAGADVTLSLFGVPDPSNPASIPFAVLEDWRRRPGSACVARLRLDVREVCASIMCSPYSSRGEGMPRMLMEAAERLTMVRY